MPGVAHEGVPVGLSTTPPGGDRGSGFCLTVHGVMAAVGKRSRRGSAWLGAVLKVHEVLAAGCMRGLRGCSPGPIRASSSATAEDDAGGWVGWSEHRTTGR